MFKKLITAIFGNTNITSTKLNKTPSIKEQRAQMVKNMTIDTSKVKTCSFDALNLPVGRELCLAEFYTVDESKQKSFAQPFSYGSVQNKVGMSVIKIKITRHLDYSDSTMLVIGEEKNGTIWRAFIQHHIGDNNKVLTNFKDLRWNRVHEGDGKYSGKFYSVSPHTEAYTLETIEIYAKMFPNPYYGKLYSRFRTAVKKHNGVIVNK